MNVVVIGCGNVGTNLAHALPLAGHSTTLVSSRTLEGLPAAADVFIVAVKDDALRGVGERLFGLRPQAFVVHTAGSLTLNDLPSPRRGVFYPLQTFSKQRMVDFRSLPIFIEAASDEDLATLQTLASSLTTRCYVMSSAERAYLHVAAVFCCNFANHLSTLAAGLLERHGIPFEVMLPLLDETINKLHTLPPREAQTGPAVRHDEGVLRQQLALLSRESNTRLAEIYSLLSESIRQTHPQNP